MIKFAIINPDCVNRAFFLQLHPIIVKAILSLLMVVFPAVCHAYDFKAEVDGVTMYFNDKGDRKVVLTYESRQLVFEDGSFGDFVEGYTQLSFLTIPSSIEYNGNTYSVVGIESGCFQNCNFKRLSLPHSITFIQTTIASLDTLCIEDAAAWCNVNGGYKMMEKSKFVLSGTEPLIHIDLLSADTLTSIQPGAFKSCTSLESVSLPTSIKTIGKEAFYNCNALETVNIQSIDVSVGDKAFQNTPWLKNQADGMIYIGKTAYCYKGSMPSGTCLSIDSGTTNIASFAFSGCAGLMSVDVPEGVKDIGESAFEDCTGLTNVTLPSTLNTIGSSAFCNTKISHISLPDNLSVIPAYLFYSCKQLEYVKLPSSLEQIGSQAFRYCTNLQSIELPSSLNTIGLSAFRNCSKLTNVTFNDCTPVISNYAFHQTGNYNKISEGIVYIGSLAYCYLGTLADSTNLELNDGTTFIGERAFTNQSGIMFLTLPNSIKRIGANAFNGCNNISHIESKIENPSECLLTSNSFTPYVFTNAQLNVPYGTKHLYSIQENWRKFKSITEAILTGDANDDGIVNVSDVVFLINKILSGEEVEYTVDDVVTCINDILSSTSDKTVDDIVDIINRILGSNIQKFNKKAADLTNDGVINVSDVVGLINVILGE